MRKILLFLFIWFALVGATIDTFEGQSVDTGTTIEGTSAADSCEGQTITSIADYCSSCTPGDPTDIRCEDFDGSYTEETGADDIDTLRCDDWTPLVDGENTLFEVTHAPGNTCTDKGTYAAKFHVEDTAGGGEEDCHLEKSITEEATLFYNLYFVITDSSGVDDNDTVGLIRYSYGATFLLYVAIWQSDVDSKWYLRMRYRNADNNNYNVDGTTEIVEDTWYRLGVEWDQTNGHAHVYLTDNLHASGSLECTSESADQDNGVTLIQLGSSEGSTQLGDNDSFDYQLDNVGTDDDTMPGACAS